MCYFTDVQDKKLVGPKLLTKKRSRKIADKQDNQSNNYDNKNNELSDRETVSLKNGKKVCNITQKKIYFNNTKTF